MANFFAELKRRHVYRVAAAYAVVAWVLIQVIANLAPILRLPDWAGTLVFVLLLAGFPIVLVFAWVVELKAPGRANDPLVGAQTGGVDWILAGALLAVIAIFGYQQFSSSPAAVTAQKVAVAAAPPVPPQASGISIAVLPFANLSGDANQEFFSDGMTDEIMTVLSKISSLRVVARTSAFEFKNQSRNIREVGQALSARYVIDGSVRKAGNRVRISAQLIQADNGVNVWADSFDRELTDIFAIQEEIAEAVAGALRVPLGLRQGESLMTGRTTDLQSYDQYLRARSLYRVRGAGFDESIKILEKLTERDPAYAPGWALLANAYTRARVPSFLDRPEEARREVQVSVAKAQAAARKAIEADARHAGGYTALGRVQDALGNWMQAEDLHRQALSMDPNDPTALENYGLMLFYVGRFKDSLSVRMRLQALEPLVPFFKRDVDSLMLFTGQSEAAIPIYESFPREMRGVTIVRMYAAVGRYADAADALLAMPDDGSTPRRFVENAARLLRSAPARAEEPLPALGPFDYFYAYVGRPERMLDLAERNLAIGFRLAVVTWGPEFKMLYTSERYKNLLRKEGLLDYWRTRSWPDFCRPQGTDDFVCD